MMNSPGSGIVGYNLQAAVYTDSHIIVAHEVINAPIDRRLLRPMAMKAKQQLSAEGDAPIRATTGVKNFSPASRQALPPMSQRQIPPARTSSVEVNSGTSPRTMNTNVPQVSGRSIALRVPRPTSKSGATGHRPA